MIELANLFVQVGQRLLQRGAADRGLSRFQVVEDPAARQLEAVALADALAVFGGEKLPRVGTPFGVFTLLGFDGFAFPSAGHGRSILLQKLRLQGEADRLVEELVQGTLGVVAEAGVDRRDLDDRAARGDEPVKALAQGELADGA